MQLELIHESVSDAIRSAVAALGGPKRVSCLLRPSWEADRAQRWLNNALDTQRPEKLEVEDIIWILREAKRIGFHQAMNYFAAECEYEARPVVPEEAEANLAKVIQQAADTMSKAMRQLEQLRPSVRAVK